MNTAEQVRLFADTPSLFIPARARTSDPDTSHEAAASLDKVATTRLEGIVREAIARFGPTGCIADELFASLPHLHSGTITPRIAPLRRKGYIVDTGQRRPGRSGRRQRVLRAK